MRIRQSAKKIFLVLKWLIIIPVILLLLVIGLLQMPAVQDQLTGTLETQLSERLQSKVQIGRIGLDFPKFITVGDVYLETPSGDSLFALGQIGVDLDMWGLLQKEVIIQKVRLDGLFARVVITDSTSNIQFLLDGFADNEQAAEAPPDLTAPARPGWQIKLLQPTLILRKLDLYYQDDPNGILVDADLKSFRGTSDRIDLERQEYRLDAISIGGGQVRLVLADRPDQTAPASSEPGASPMTITCRELHLEQTSFDMNTADLELQATVPEGKLEATQLRLGNSVSLTADQLSIADGAYSMNLGSSHLPTSGFNPGNFKLDQINIGLEEIQYSADSLSARIRRVEARESHGRSLTQLSGQIHYYPDGLKLADLIAKTQGSTVSIPTLRLDYPFQSTANADTTFAIEGIVQMDLAMTDLLFFVPALDSIAILAANRKEQLVFNAGIHGDQEAVYLRDLQAQAPGIQLNGVAGLRAIMDNRRRSANLQLRDLVVNPGKLRPLLPDSLLPQYIAWPQAFRITGSLDYHADSIGFDLRGLEVRDSGTVETLLTLKGQVKHYSDYPNSTLGISLDTLRLTRQSLEAYLPPQSIPAGYRLPGLLLGTATAGGEVGNLTVNAQIGTATGRTQLQTRGTILNLPHTDSLWVDLSIPHLLVNMQELNEILPDSTLPTNLALPDLRMADGQISGALRDLEFELPFSTDNGNGRVAGYYGGDRYTLQSRLTGFQIERLFRGPRADSLALLALEPLELDLQSSGQLSPTLDAQLELTLAEGAKGDLLELEGNARGDTLSGSMRFSHNDLQGTASTTYLRRDSFPGVQGSIFIRRADLQRWRLSDRPLFLSGSSRFEANGLQLDNLSAQLRLQDILLRSDTSTAFVDSLFAYAEMHQGKNEIEVFSDLLSFSLEGSFRPVLVAKEIARFVRAYWQEDIDQPDPVVYGNYLRAYLEIHNPKPLTSGIIPGLQELSPMSATFLYREQQPELSFIARIPTLDYAGIRMDSLDINTRGSRKNLKYQADWQNINLFDQVILGQTQISGTNTEQALSANFRVFDENGETRHHIDMLLDPEIDSIRIRLASKQIIDYLVWNIPPDNLLQVSGKQIQIDNWALHHEDQYMRLRSPDPKTIVMELERINLAPFGRLIRSDEEIVGGVMDGAVTVRNPFTDLTFEAGTVIQDLSIYQRLWGDLSVKLANQQAEIYRLDLQLAEAENEVTLAGTFVPGGALDLQLDLASLKLETIEPLSLGYLSNAQGRLTGSLSIAGNFDRPSYQGQLRFEDAAMDVPMLKTRFQIEHEPIRFNGRSIAISNLSLVDPQNNEATLRGTINVLSLSNYAFNLTASARDFLVLNTGREDNKLYYGYLRADADVQISGDLLQPVLEVTASPKSNSRLTYLLDQSAVPQAESRVGIVRFVEQYEWQQTIVADSLQQIDGGRSRGFDLTTNLNVNPGLEFTVVIDPVTGDQFTGRGEGDIVFRQYADGRMEMTGRIEMVEGLYDFTYQGLINRKFTVEPGSSISWQGDPMNPELNLSISSYVQTSPSPLVTEFMGPTEANLRRQQTFAVRLYLKGTLESMQVSTDIIYPEELSGNSGLPAIEQSLTMLRTDQSQLNTQAFGLLLFKGFVNFGDAASAPGDPIDNSVQTGLDNVLSQQLNNLANRYINFVELDFGMESFNTDQGGRQRDLRLSLRKRLFNDRLIISIDGVTQTGEIDERNSLPQTYLDNLTAEFLLSKNGGLRLKIFSNRELDQFTTGDVVRVGGHLAFSKDFNRFFWSSGKRPAKDVPASQLPPEAAGREGEQKLEIEQE